MKQAGTAPFLLWTLFAILAVQPIHAQNQPAKPTLVPVATYTDPAGEPSFDYPVVWKVDTAAKFYLSPHILQGGLTPQVQVVFWPAGNYYAKTTLTDLVFVYAKVARQSQPACDALAIGSLPAKTDTMVIHGNTFQHFNTSDAGMCHGVNQNIYWTLRGGTCYLFEGDMHTSCSGAVPGQRDLTPTETHALMRHLNSIPQSIRFAPAQ